MPTTVTNSPSFVGLSVLLADDEEINGLLTEAFLNQYGFEVTIVGNGQEALTAASTNRFDIIILDIQMPIMDGLEACTLLRQMESKTQRPTPIIAVTASKSATFRHQCLEHGFSDFIGKPFQSKDLLAKMACHLVTTSEP